MAVVEEAEGEEEDGATETAAERDGSAEEALLPEDTAPTTTRSQAQEGEGSGTVHPLT